MSDLKNKIENQLSAMHESGTYKNERIIGSSQETCRRIFRKNEING